MNFYVRVCCVDEWNRSFLLHVVASVIMTTLIQISQCTVCIMSWLGKYVLVLVLIVLGLFIVLTKIARTYVYD